MRRAAELLRLMPFKAPPDLSKFLLSPMPGLLVDVAVSRARRCWPARSWRSSRR
jgi:propionyl-CoA carboxylase alpha chain